MSTDKVQQRRSLLVDPEQVALVRNLIHHAHKVRAEHFTYAIGPRIDGTGYGPQEHVWALGAGRVSYHEGALAYQRNNVTILSGAGFDNARDVADLLAAIGVLPQAFASAYKAGQDATRKNIAGLVAGGDRTGQRRAEPGEMCTCGRQAVTVFTGGQFGDTGYCGLPDGGQSGPCRFCGGERHEGQRCSRYELRPAGSAS